jgi:hypothetical protein
MAVANVMRHKSIEMPPQKAQRAVMAEIPGVVELRHEHRVTLETRRHSPSTSAGTLLWARVVLACAQGEGVVLPHLKPLPVVVGPHTDEG